MSHDVTLSLVESTKYYVLRHFTLLSRHSRGRISWFKGGCSTSTSVTCIDIRLLGNSVPTELIRLRRVTLKESPNLGDLRRFLAGWLVHEKQRTDCHIISAVLQSSVLLKGWRLFWLQCLSTTRTYYIVRWKGWGSTGSDNTLIIY